MSLTGQSERLWANLTALGGRRLAALGIVGASVAAAAIFGGIYLSRPTLETLYSGLDRNDVASIGSTLREAGVSFDVSADETTMLVPLGEAPAARMILAEKGLPHSGTVGNELFDKLGSLGLTSFMQDVTRLRAMEGELSRTIQMIRGVKAARVHVVMGDEGSFRRDKQEPSASVVIRTDGGDDRAVGRAISHLVAAAIPNMKIDSVTVLNVDGRLLTDRSDSSVKSPENWLAMETQVGNDIRERVNQTLAPYLSLRNFQVSVAARLNGDQKQTSETIFDPNSRVERSVRSVKETQNSQNAAGQAPVGVDASLPKAKPASDVKQSNDASQKREDTTNYELSSKSITTTGAGVAIDGVSVAILINRSALAASLGDKATPAAMEKQVAEIEQLASSSAGLRKERGDTIKIAVVDFVDTGKDLEPVEGPSIGERLLRHLGAFINAGAIVMVAAMVLFLGVRPATRALMAPRAPIEQAQIGSGPAILPIAGASNADSGFPMLSAGGEEEPDKFLATLLARRGKTPQRYLQRLVDFDEEHAAAVLRQWIREGVST